MPWQARQGQLGPAGDKSNATRQRPAPFVVDGRRAETLFMEFQRKTMIKMAGGPYRAIVEVLLAHRPWWDRVRNRSDEQGWSKLLAFDLNTQLSAADPGIYMVRPNHPGQVP
jgi:hypothetical protein